MTKNDLKKRLEAIQSQLESLDNQLKSMENKLNIQSQRSFWAQMKVTFTLLSWSIFLSGFIGVIGNLFVSLWFQPTHPLQGFGLGVSGFLLISLLATFLYDTYWISKNWDKEMRKIFTERH